MIDFRSDTTTRPSFKMREAMMHAEVGDDAYREDPTTNRLEKLAAQITGKEASLFVSSGSMGNLISLYINGGRGNEVLTSRTSHILCHELAAPTAIAGIMPIGLDAKRGILDAETIAAHIHPSDYPQSNPSLIELENTSNGTCYPLEKLQEIWDLANTHNLKIHMDGARLFNAVVALDTTAESICKYTDTVSFCLSKGLGAPVGSMLCGTNEFIDKARHLRKLLGGSMRQTGILAAAGIYALEHHIDRLRGDHQKAVQLAEALNQCRWVQNDPEQVETNIISFHTVGVTASDVVNRLAEHGILCLAMTPKEIRMVTHLDIIDDDIELTISVLKNLF